MCKDNKKIIFIFVIPNFFQFFWITPKYFSKNPFNFSITVFFFSCRLPPPKRDIAGSILSMSVPVVRIAPSRKAFSTNLAVSSAFRFSLAIIAFKASCLRRNLLSPYGAQQSISRWSILQRAKTKPTIARGIHTLFRNFVPRS